MSPERGERRGADAVFFDVGGTLVEVSPSIGHVYARACAERGASVEPEAIQVAFDHAWMDLSQEVPRGADRYRLYPGGERGWWERVSARAFDLVEVPPARRPGVDDLRGAFARAEAWTVYPDALPSLLALRRRGYRLGVISNWDSRLPRLLETLGLGAHFETLVFSAQMGYEKPHPAIFEAATRALGVEASRSVHVGDRPDEDYAGARAAGMRALLLVRARPGASAREEEDRWGDAGDRVVDLAEAVQRIAG